MIFQSWKGLPNALQLRIFFSYMEQIERWGRNEGNCLLLFKKYILFANIFNFKCKHFYELSNFKLLLFIAALWTYLFPKAAI